jgi:hypothetical protein
METMTDRKQTHLPILAISMIMLAMIACGGSDKVTPTTQLPAETAVPTVVEAAERVTPIATADDFVPTYIVLGGKVVNSRTGEWPDNRLVLLFLKGKEIGRDTTSMRISLPVSNGGIIRRGQFPDSEQGIVDGVFVIVAPNPYQITLSQLNATRTAFTGIRTTQSAYPLPLTDKEAYHWFSEIEEGSTCEISILPKNIKYVLKIIEGDVALLPAEIQAPGSTALQDDGTIVVALSEAEQGQTAPPDVDAQVQDIKYDDNPRLVELNKFTVSIDNCGGSAPISQKYTQSQTFIHEYHTNVSFGIGLEISLFWLAVVPQLQFESGYSNGQIETKTIEYDMRAEPKTRVTYVFTWQEEWKTGAAEVMSGGDLISIPFEIRTNLIYNTDSESFSCQ